MTQRKLTVREYENNKVVWTMDPPEDIRLSHLQFTPDGKRLVTGTLNCTILFWDWTKKP
jgi:WD40 repeat protein